MLDGHEVSLVEADGSAGAQKLDAGAARALGEGAGRLEAVLDEEQRAARLGALVDEGDPLSLLGGLDRLPKAVAAAADDEHVDVAALGVEAPLALAVRVELAEASGVAQQLLVERPQSAGSDEGLVVEARRRERAPPACRSPRGRSRSTEPTTF